MPLDLYRRHSPDCRYFGKGQNFTKCSCVIWVYGQLKGRPVRRSMKTRDWSLARKVVERMEADPTGAMQEAVTIAGAVRQYLADCQRRKLKESTITSYRNAL